MGSRDPRVDAYIARSAEFARPILSRLREIVHASCPDVLEDIKWGSPHFMYHGMLCGMAAFKQHASFGFWKAKQVVGEAADDAAMGQFGCLRTVADLPAEKVLAGYIRRAMAVNENPAPAPDPGRKKTARPPIPEPDYFSKRLGLHPRAKATYDAFSPSHKRDYLEWITEAKTEATRGRRLDQAIEWMEEGKARHWKYAKC